MENTIDSLFELATRLGRLKIFKATLEVDMRELETYREAIYKYVQNAKTVGLIESDFSEWKDSYLKIFIKVYGIKILIECRNVGIEPRRTFKTF